MRTLIPKTQVMNIHIIGSGKKKKKEKKIYIVSDWLYANEFVLGVRNCGGKTGRFGIVAIHMPIQWLVMKVELHKL